MKALLDFQIEVYDYVKVILHRTQMTMIWQNQLYMLLELKQQR